MPNIFPGVTAKCGSLVFKAIIACDF